MRKCTSMIGWTWRMQDLRWLVVRWTRMVVRHPSNCCLARLWKFPIASIRGNEGGMDPCNKNVSAQSSNLFMNHKKIWVQNSAVYDQSHNINIRSKPKFSFKKIRPSKLLFKLKTKAIPKLLWSINKKTFYINLRLRWKFSVIKLGGRSLSWRLKKIWLRPKA